MKFIHSYFASRSLQGKFLAIAVPLVFVSTFGLFALLEAYTYRTAVRDLRSGLDQLVASQSAALSNPLWNVDETQISLTLKAIVTHPDVVGARVFEVTGRELSSTGITDFDEAAIRAEHDIVFMDDGTERAIGRLGIAMSDARVLAAIMTRFMLAGGLAILVVLCVTASVMIAHRRTIGIPLQRLLASISLERTENIREPVAWDSKDEAGAVIAAFNEMQIQQATYEDDLRSARDTLEQRVAERTAELEEARNELATMLEVTTQHADVVEEELHERAEELTDKSNSMEQLSKKLSKYLSPQIYDSIFHNEQEVEIASTRKKLTVFFSDIAGFTETADRLESEELTALLNHYLTEMSQIALEHGATIDKFIGDAIMIFFGDPETKGVKEDALACVHMAIAMRNRMDDLQQIWRASGIENPLSCRMGIHTDYCTVGNFGSETRMDYTIIGGGVNLASRLEAAATPGNILVSYETFAHVSDQIVCKEHGKIEVKGIAYPVDTYQVIDTHEAFGEERSHFREDHPNVKLDLDFNSMTLEDRTTITSILQQALQYLSIRGELANTEHAAIDDINSDESARSLSEGSEDPRNLKSH